jgi:hypothetical protein
MRLRRESLLVCITRLLSYKKNVSQMMGTQPAHTAATPHVFYLYTLFSRRQRSRYRPRYGVDSQPKAITYKMLATTSVPIMTGNPRRIHKRAVMG